MRSFTFEEIKEAKINKQDRSSASAATGPVDTYLIVNRLK